MVAKRLDRSIVSVKEYFARMFRAAWIDAACFMPKFRVLSRASYVQAVGERQDKGRAEGVLLDLCLELGLR